MSEISKLIIPGNTVPYDLRDDYAREKIDNNHIFITSPLITGIVNVYTFLGRSVEPYDGLMLHILCVNDNDTAIAPGSIRLVENGATIAIEYPNAAHSPINNKIYSFILHQVPAEGANPAYWSFYPMDEALISKEVQIIEQTTGASTAYLEVSEAVSKNIFPIVHYVDTDNDDYEYWLPLWNYTTDEESYIFSAPLASADNTGGGYLDCLEIRLYSDWWEVYGLDGVRILSTGEARKLFYRTCSTAADVVTKTVTGIDGWPNSLSAGQTILIKFQYTNTARNITLSVNGSTAAPILAYDGIEPITTWEAGSIFLFIYSGTDWRLVDGNNTLPTLNELGVGYGTCGNGLPTLAKTVSISGYKLIVGGLVTIKFTYSVIANSTLNINSTGAQPINYNGAAIQSNIIQNGDIALFVYTGSAYELLTVNSKNVLPLTTSSDYIICTTAASTSTKTATLSGFTLPTAASPSGRRIAVNFKQSVPANAKLNISSTGARDIICNNAKIIANTIQADDVVTIDSYWNSSLTTPTAQYIVRAIDRNNIRHVYQDTLGIHNASTTGANGHIYESPTDIKGYWTVTMSIGSTTVTAPTVYLYNITGGFANIAPDMVNQVIGSAYVENGSKEYTAPIVLDEIVATDSPSLRTHLANFTAPANSTPTYHLQIACPKK